MRRFGQVQGARSTGQMEKLLLIGLGLLVVLLVQFLPFAGDRQAGSSAVRPAPTAVPTRTAPPTPVPVEAAAPPAEESPSAPEAGRASTADPPTYRVVAGGAGANLRSAPSTGAPVVRQLRDGAEVTNLNQQQTADGLTWRRVAEGDAEGWVAAELLAP
jgi:hypothetical protein